MDNEIWLQLHLTENPFPRKYLKELCPVDEKDLLAYTRVDGFKRGFVTINNWVSSAQNLDEGVILLICGPSGAGRTSFVNYVLHQFCRAKGSTSDKLLEMRVSVRDHHEIIPIQSLMLGLYEQLLDMHIDMKNEFSELGDLYHDYVLDGSKTPNENIFRIVFNKSLKIIQKKHLEPIIVLENVRSHNQISTCINVFGRSKLLLCTSEDNHLLNNFEAGNLNAIGIKLSGLEVEDVEEFLKQRWKSYSSSDNHPFDMNAINEIFMDMNWPIRNHVELFTEIFEQYIMKLPSILGQAEAALPLIDESALQGAFIKYCKRKGLMQI